MLTPRLRLGPWLIALAVSMIAALTPAAAAGVADAATAAAATTQQSGWDDSAPATATLIQLGDLHGHLTPRPNLRADGSTSSEGGLARVATTIRDIRADSPESLLFNVGDTLQGGAEALHTEGAAMSDVLDKWSIDGYASGNWDFAYGTERYLELFKNGRWGGVAANLYYDGAPYADKTGQRVLPPYRVIKTGGLRVGVVGFTSEGGPTVGASTTKGFRFTGEGEELPEMIDTLRNTEKVDLVVMLSELGLAKNLQLADRYPGVDVLLSADMHEETQQLVTTSSGTLVSEVGQDGTTVGQLDLQLASGSLTGWRYTFHTMDDSVPSDPDTAKQVDKIRSAFVAGKGLTTHVNPINGTTLSTPIAKVVGQADTALYRGNFSDHEMPGVVEGSSHNFLADAVREQTGADVGTIRGFRYGTTVAPGEIRLEDIYHYIPAGPYIAKGTVSGQRLRDYLEKSLDGVLNPDVFAWTRSWAPAFSGLRYDLDAYAGAGQRTKNITLFDRSTKTWLPLEPARQYTVGGYWYENKPDDVGSGLRISDTAQPVVGADGKPLDAIEVVSRHLDDFRADPELGRVRLLAPLPAPAHGNPEIQPLRGVPTTRPGRHLHWIERRRPQQIGEHRAFAEAAPSHHGAARRHGLGLGAGPGRPWLSCRGR